MKYQSTRIMEILKQATSEQHRDAERRQLQRDMVRGQLTPETYGSWLGQMYLIHRALWQAISGERAAHPRLHIVEDHGLHAANLHSDLADFGVDAEETDALPSAQRALRSIEAVSADDPLSLLGYNYVLEGSMNGNRYIARALDDAPGIAATRYLDPYGEEQRSIWHAYRERMNSGAFTEDEAQRIVAAARDMFGFMAEMSEELAAQSVSV